jgi:hypothetical protein
MMVAPKEKWNRQVVQILDSTSFVVDVCPCADVVCSNDHRLAVAEGCTLMDRMDCGVQLPNVDMRQLERRYIVLSPEVT